MDAPEVPAEEEAPRKPALSPSRASDFKQCPLLYRYRVVDKLPETPSPVQVRGTLVHTVLERLFALPAAERVPERAKALLVPAWEELAAAEPELAEVFQQEALQPGQTWLESAGTLLDTYFQLEDPRLLEPEACELRLETEIGEGVRLRGFVDRLDVAPNGDLRVVDYKTGAAPREIGEVRAAYRELFVQWETKAADIVAYLRMDAGVHPDDPKLSALVGELSVKSPEFRRLWATHDVKEKNHGVKQLRHPLVGELTLAYESFVPPGDSDQTLITYHAELASASAEALQLLASWGADATRAEV